MRWIQKKRARPGVAAFDHVTHGSYQMKHRSRRILKFVLLTLASLLMGFCGLKIFIAGKVYKLQHMLTDLQRLKPGISSFDEAMGIAGRYGAKPTEFGPCAREKCTLVMRITWCNPDWVPTKHLDNRYLNRFGIHFWTAVGSIEVEQNRVTATGAEIAVEGSDPQHLWHEADWSLDEVIPQVNEQEEKQFLHNFDPRRYESPNFLVDWTGSGHTNRMEILNARISTHATGEQRRAAQDFSLKCLTKWGDCSSVCELLPEATRYYNRMLGVSELAFAHPHCD